ncbi:MAG: hypothetical protein NVS9B3_12470 [Gemmatimonadaceae bacterium]
MTPRGVIYIVAELTGTVAALISELQRRYDPKMAAMMQPHITLAGSSGMGPLPGDLDRAVLVSTLADAARGHRAMSLRFAPPTRFMQTDIIVLPLDPHGPIRALHESIKTSGLPYARPRFAFTPHCTLSFYPTLDDASVRRLLTVRIDEPAVIDRVQAYRTEADGRSQKLAEVALESTASG